MENEYISVVLVQQQCIETGVARVQMEKKKGILREQLKRKPYTNINNTYQLTRFTPLIPLRVHIRNQSKQPPVSETQYTSIVGASVLSELFAGSTRDGSSPYLRRVDQHPRLYEEPCLMKCSPHSRCFPVGDESKPTQIEAKPGQKHVTEVVCVVLLAIEYRLEKIRNC